MSLATSYSDALYSQLKFYAAWFPVANTFKLGDYGLIDGGIFRAMGNIAEYKVGFKEKASPTAPIDFMSEGTSVTRVAGNVEVKALPQKPGIQGKLLFKFMRANSCLIKADQAVAEMQNIKQVGQALAARRDWERRFRVVSSVSTGQQCVVVAAEKANTTVEFSGTIDLLKQLEAGKGSAKVAFSSSNERLFKAVGDTGVLGLRFFRIGWFGRVKLLSAASSRKQVPIETHEKWGAKLRDDL